MAATVRQLTAKQCGAVVPTCSRGAQDVGGGHTKRERTREQKTKSKDTHLRANADILVPPPSPQDVKETNTQKCCWRF